MAKFTGVRSKQKNLRRKTTIHGVSELRANLRKMNDEGKQAVLEALDDEAGKLFERSQREVPVDTGQLKRSGRKLKTRMLKSGPQAKIKYGGKRAPYAVRIHFTVKQYVGISIKWLEPGMLTRMARVMRRFIEHDFRPIGGPISQKRGAGGKFI